MKTIKIIGILFSWLLMSSCNNGQSLQEYYVENQENKDFVAIDIPASMFANVSNLDEEQRRTLETIKKINVLAIPKKTANQEKIEAEKANVANILNNDKYELLMRLGGGDSRVEFYFTGSDEAVDELIVYGFDENRGMGIARVLGDDMNPGEIINLVRSMESGDLQLEGLAGISKLFVESKE